MKLLVVAPYFYPKIGGMENYAWNISKGLKEKHGWDVVVITSNHLEKKLKIENINGIRIYRLPALFKISNTPINPIWFFKINSIIKPEKPDIINGHTPVPFIADLAALSAYRYSIPFILTYQNDLVKDNLLGNLIINLYYMSLGKLTGKIVRIIIATSRIYAEKSFYLKNYLDKVKIIPPGVDIDFINSVKLSADLKKKYIGKKVVLFVGQLDRTHAHKGLNYLIESISIVKKSMDNVKLLVIGKGDMIDEYRNQTQDLGIGDDVEFKENVDNKQLIEYYKLSDVVVLPSTTDSEGFGMVLIEAGACKKPVIGSNIGGISGVIKHNETGLLVDPKNLRKLTHAINQILSNPKLAKKLGENGFKLISKEFIWPKRVEQTYSILKEL